MQAVYRLKDDKTWIAQVQKATLTTKEFGIAQTNGLFASQEWWDQIAQGKLVLHTLNGTIDRVFMGSMNDWPMFTVVSDSGERSDWTRKVHEASLDRLYREGAQVEIDFVWQKHKTQIKGWDRPLEHKQVIEIRISPAMSSPLSP